VILTNTAKLLNVLMVALLLSSCGYTPTLSSQKPDSAGRSVDTRTIGNAVPKVEPITRAGNKSPYKVFGKTYFLLPTSKGYSETGVASWYGTKFHGRKTANGEIYNMYGMTAAHKSLPIPSYVRVTNVENMRSIIVRINDRGPFHGPRIIDLSYVGAMKLGFVEKGTAKVLVTAIDPSGGQTKTIPATLTASPEEVVVEAVPETSVAAEPTLIITPGSYLQVGAFNNAGAAQVLQKKVRLFTQRPILVQQREDLFKVWIGPIADNIELLLIKRTLEQVGNISGFTVTP
jgi:rare lipoprotein A